MARSFTWRDYRALDRRIWILAGARAVNTMGLSLVMAFMAIYLVGERGLLATTYGGIYLVANLCQSLAQGSAGELSDRLGRRGLMRGALFARSVVIAVLGFEILFETSIWIIAPTLVVSSTLRGLFEPVAYAAVADIAKPRERVAAFGLQRMGTNFGWALGPALGGLLSQVMDYGAVFFCSAPALLIAGIAASSIREPAARKVPDQDTSLLGAIRESAARPVWMLLLGCALLAAVVHVQLFSTLAIYNSTILQLSNADVGLIFTVNGCLVLLLQLPAIAFIERLGMHRSLVLGSLLYAAAFAQVGSSSAMAGVAFAVVILTLGEVVLAPSQQAVVANLGGNRMGRAYGMLGLAQMLGVAVAPLIGGAAYDALHRDGLQLWLALATLPVALAAGYLVFNRVSRRVASRPQPATISS